MHVVHHNLPRKSPTASENRDGSRPRPGVATVSALAATLRIDSSSDVADSSPLQLRDWCPALTTLQHYPLCRIYKRQNYVHGFTVLFYSSHRHRDNAKIAAFAPADGIVRAAPINFPAAIEAPPTIAQATAVTVGATLETTAVPSSSRQRISNAVRCQQASSASAIAVSLCCLDVRAPLCAIHI